MQLTLTRLVDRTRALAPDLYQRYQAMLLEGARSDPDPGRDQPVPPLAVEQTHAVMATTDEHRDTNTQHSNK